MIGWDWRKALNGGWMHDSDRRDDVAYFHAYHAENTSACEPSLGLIASCEEPNEGSSFCPDCMDVVRTVDGHDVAADYRAKVERIRAERAEALR